MDPRSVAPLAGGRVESHPGSPPAPHIPSSLGEGAWDVTTKHYAERGVVKYNGRYVRVSNLHKYQHYKDRSPPWVKLHNSTLEDYDFCQLPDSHKWHVLGLILLASRVDNKIAADPKYIAERIGARTKVDLGRLMESGFIEPWVEETPKEQWKTRYVPEVKRSEILAADKACLKCGNAKHLEIDHVVPVSLPVLIDDYLNGDPAAPENLQVLCRSCNRIKRTAASTPSEIAEWCLSARSEGLRSKLLRSADVLRTERQRQRERERESRAEAQTPLSVRGNGHDPQREDIKAQIQDVWDSHLEAHTLYYESKNGQAPAKRDLTAERKKAIREAIRSHGFEKAEAAGRGIFLSGFHTGKNEEGKEHLGAHLPWRINKSGDNVERFSEILAEYRVKRGLDREPTPTKPPKRMMLMVEEDRLLPDSERTMKDYDEAYDYHKGRETGEAV